MGIRDVADTLIVIPAYGRPDLTECTVKSVIETTGEEEEIVVVDCLGEAARRIETETNKTIQEWINDKDPTGRVSWVVTGTKWSKSKTLNHYLVRTAITKDLPEQLKEYSQKFKYFITVDNDMELHYKGWAGILGRELNAHSEAEACAFQIIEPDEDNPPINKEGWVTNLGNVFTTTDRRFIASGIMCVTRSLLQRVGYWYEPLQTWGQDVEWCKRVQNAGGNLRYVTRSKLTVTHHHKEKPEHKEYRSNKRTEIMGSQQLLRERLAYLDDNPTDYYWEPTLSSH